MSGVSRPSHLRRTPLVDPTPRPFGERAHRVIKLLARGWSRLEAAREVGMDKANVRVIELRARRRGLLAGVETRVEPTNASAVAPPTASPTAVSALSPTRWEERAARIRMARAAGRTTTDIAAEHNVSRQRIAQILKRTAGQP